MHHRHTLMRAAQTLGVVFLLMTARSAAQTTQTSTEANQQELTVTVYNSNTGLVRDVRKLTLPRGQISLNFTGVATEIRPSTVHVVSLTAPKQFSVLEQDYRYDLLTPQKLLQQYVGKQLTLIRQVTDNNSTKEVSVQAELLSDSEGPVWRIGNEIVTGMSADRYVFPSLPNSLYSKPTLVWLVDNNFSGPQTLEADYLTNGLNWSADYVLTLPAQSQVADLNAWVTVTNHSGATYRDAHLQLVTGQLHQTPEAPRPMARKMAMGMVSGAMAQEVTETPVAEYHLYALSRPATLLNNDDKQIKLLASTGVATGKTYEVNGQPFYYESPLQGGQPVKEPVQAHVKFKNSEANSLGVPLPAGVVRVYQADSQGHLQFIGEDRIAPTAKDEMVDLYTGNAFDVIAERKQTGFQSLGHNSYETAFDITLRNHKDEPVTVEVNEPIGGDWTMLKSNYKFEKTSAFSARFSVPVAANGESVLSYRARVRR